MKSGMLAAEAVFEVLASASPATEPESYGEKIEASWLWTELYKVRNIRPAFCQGLWLGMGYAALDTYLLRGKAPWTFHHHTKSTNLKPPASDAPVINYPKPDNIVSFDKNSSVYLSEPITEKISPPICS